MKLPHALKERPPRCRFTLCQLVTSNESHQNSSLNGAEAPGSGFPSPPGGAHPLPPPALEQSIRDRGEHTRVRERNPGAGAQCAPVPRALEPPEGKGVSVPGARRGAETAKPGGQSRGAHGPPPAAPLPSPEHLMRDDGRFFNSETQQSRTFSKAGSSGRAQLQAQRKRVSRGLKCPERSRNLEAGGGWGGGKRKREVKR
ncbi:uncharacterized protein LOC128851794 isoform X2 [Cuculus canorus]|uniref:uncharacterized protein LOC128851794 isoform X2 n=1 Tax=Cuculus canorus TaxID=55661 RepID=UPI0023AA2BAC|nr:uncharacterized protein LOC128851794 isoform X2 [Cuculus canorus]